MPRSATEGFISVGDIVPLRNNAPLVLCSIEGPNKALLLWIVCAILVLSGVVSVVYAVVMKSEEQGFGIGQWIVAVLSTALAALYYQWEHV